MYGLLIYSMEEKAPIEMIYLSSKGEISFRTVIVKKIEQDRIYVYCLTKQNQEYLSELTFYQLLNREHEEGLIMRKLEPTIRQQEVLEAIEKYISINGYPPSMRKFSLLTV